MNVRQLLHFLAVVEHGSLGRAAKAIHLSQPALSKSIQRLEEACQARLLDRTPLGMVPTEIGHALIRHARTIETELRRAKTDVEEMRGAQGGSLTVGAGPVVGLELLPTVVSRLLAKNPRARIVVVDALGSALTSGLRSGELDLTVAGHVESDPAVDLVSEDLYRDQMLVVARRGHPLAKKDKVTLDDLLAVPWVLVRRPDTMRQYLDDLFRGWGVEPPLPAIETDSVPFIHSVLSSTDFLSFMPSTVLAWPKPARAAHDLVALGPDFCVRGRVVKLTRRRDASISPLASQFARELKSLIAESFQPPSVAQVRGDPGTGLLA